jgi:hypothetical protein
MAQPGKYFFVYTGAKKTLKYLLYLPIMVLVEPLSKEFGGITSDHGGHTLICPCRFTAAAAAVAAAAATTAAATDTATSIAAATTAVFASTSAAF